MMRSPDRRPVPAGHQPERLYFPDGSFWVMDYLSTGNEQDAGTRYPTLMQDSNGNQVILRYDKGVGLYWGNSSSRVVEIEDVRATQDPLPPNTWRSYKFTYNTDGNNYISSVVTTLNQNTAYQAQSKVEQTLDTHGNVTQMKVFDFGNLTTPARTYNYTHVNDSNYTSRYIFIFNGSVLRHDDTREGKEQEENRKFNYDVLNEKCIDLTKRRTP